MDRPRRLCLAICELIWLLAPRSDRTAAVAERRSHLFDSCAAGVSGCRDLVATFAGVGGDFRCAAWRRRHHSGIPLGLAVFVEPDLSLVTAGALFMLFVPAVWIHVRVIQVISGFAFAGTAIVLFGGFVGRRWYARRDRTNG